MNNDSQIHGYMKIARDDSAVKLGCCSDVAFHSTPSEKISDQRKIFVVLSKGIRCNFKASFIAMTGDRNDKLASIGLGMITVMFVKILTIIPVWLCFSSFLFLLCFVFEHETINTIRVLAVFDFYHLK